MTNVGGQIKEATGSVTGDRSLQGEGVADQLLGKAQQALGAAKDAVSTGGGPLAEQARGFAKARPFATAALVGVVGLALLNTLRGRS